MKTTVRTHLSLTYAIWALPPFDVQIYFTHNKLLPINIPPPTTTNLPTKEFTLIFSFHFHAGGKFQHPHLTNFLAYPELPTQRSSEIFIDLIFRASSSLLETSWKSSLKIR